MKKSLFFIISVLLNTLIFAQQYTISGSAGDYSSGKKLGYANIRVAGTTNGTAANINGKYELKLSGGNYTLIASFIGYYSDTLVIDVNKNIYDVNFHLQQTEITLPEIVVLPGENPALEIIRKAIARKNEMNSKLLSYEFEAYTKGILRTEDEIYARGNSINIGSGSDDSTDLKITGILENRSKGYYKKPGNFKEVILARKQSANFPSAINTLTSGRIIQNFYENDVQFFGDELTGPIADDALNFYNFYLDKITAINNSKVFKIDLYPKEEQDPGFIGSIYITDSTYNLIKVDLQVNDAANTGGILDTISVVQQFADYDDIFMPIDYHLLVRIDFIGIVRAGFELNSVLYDYNINKEIDDERFDKAIITVLTDADTKDSLYWVNTITIPNTEEEELAYKRIDSLDNIPRSFWDDFSVLSSQIYFDDKFSISGPLSWYGFNRISGHNLNFSLFLDDAFNRRFNSSLDMAYGFADKKVNTEFYSKYFLGDYRTFTITLNAFNRQNILFGESDNYNNLTATVATLFFKDDFRDYYYSHGFNIKLEGEVTPVIDLRIGFINHTDKSAAVNTDYSFFNKEKKYRDNPPVFEGKINAFTAGFSLDFRNYIENGYYRRRTSEGKSYVLFSGDVTYSNNDLIKSDINYTTYRLKSNGFIRTFRSAYFNFKLLGIYSDGALPYQSLFSLPGNIDYVSKDMSFRTLNLNEIFGDKVVILNFEHHFWDELFRLSKIPWLKTAKIYLKLFFNAAISRVTEETKNLSTAMIKEFSHPFYEIGFGIGQGIIPIQLEFAWKLNYLDGNNFRFGINAFLF